MPTVVTANHLRTGAVVYLADGGRWVSALAEATVAIDERALAPLEAIARAAVEANAITAVYAFDVRIADGRPQPISVRETIRAAQAL
jgi:Protein of unknown function (DUF2849)